MSRFWKAIIAAVVVTLVLSGAVYAYETLWSGATRITVEPPGDLGELEVTEIRVHTGTWNESTKTWTVSLVRGEYTFLDVYLKNTGSEIAVVSGRINGSLSFSPREGVSLSTGYQPAYNGIGIMGGQTGAVRFSLSAEVDAEAGEVPEVQLQVVNGPID